MNYEETLIYLQELPQRGIQMQLESVRQILNHFGNPQLAIPTVHIAGTNGKGSTAAFTESILRASGFRVGLLTSPHLLDFRERIQIDRKLIGKEKFAEIATQIKHAETILKCPLTYFEFLTVGAFLHFAEEEVDWNVLEVGLGGRLDATNVCDATVCIITPIAMDHMKFLGNDEIQIAKEKLGIIKNPKTAIIGKQNNNISQLVKNVLLNKNINLKSFEEDYNITQNHEGPGKRTFNYSSQTLTLNHLETSLAGSHQMENAAVAIAACAELTDTCPSITPQSIRKGIRQAEWAGRLEIVETKPWLILDCAHNPQGVKKMTTALRDFFPFDRCITVLGVMQDKDYSQIFENILDISDHVILTRPTHHRSLNPQTLLEQSLKTDKVIEIIEEIPYALYVARELAHSSDLICVTGSIFTVAEAKQSIINERLN